MGFTAIRFAGSEDRKDSVCTSEAQKGLTLLIDPLALRRRWRAEHNKVVAIFERLLERPIDAPACWQIGAVSENWVQRRWHGPMCAEGADDCFRGSIAIELMVQPVRYFFISSCITEEGSVAHLFRL
jgi:hypothetical protein